MSAPRSLKQLAQDLLDQVAELLAERDALVRENCQLRTQLEHALDRYGVPLSAFDEEES